MTQLHIKLWLNAKIGLRTITQSKMKERLFIVLQERRFFCFFLMDSDTEQVIPGIPELKHM